MSLRKKIALILLGVAVTYTAVDNGSARFFVPTWFESWEIEDAQRSLARVQASIQEDRDTLAAKAKIWANSEGVFQFVSEDDDAFAGYLENRGFDASDVDVFFVCDGEGQVRWKRAVDPDTREPISVRDAIPGGALSGASALRSPRQ